MSRRRRLSGSEVRQILETNGFVLVRQRGSHQILQKRESGKTLTVPVPDHNDLKAGTMASIIRQSQLSRSLFE